MAEPRVIAQIGADKAESLPGDFEALAVQHSRQLYNIALRMTGNEEEAKDLAQDALVRAFRSFHRWKRECSFSSWLYRIATNLYIDWVRRKKKIRFESLDAPLTTDEGDEIDRSMPDADNDPGRLAELSEIRSEIQKGLDQLPPEFRLALILCDMQGFSYAEISEVMECSIGTVRSRIHRARRALRNYLLPYMSEAVTK